MRPNVLSLLTQELVQFRPWLLRMQRSFAISARTRRVTNARIVLAMSVVRTTWVTHLTCAPSVARNLKDAKANLTLMSEMFLLLMLQIITFPLRLPSVNNPLNLPQLPDHLLLTIQEQELGNLMTPVMTSYGMTPMVAVQMTHPVTRDQVLMTRVVPLVPLVVTLQAVHREEPPMAKCPRRAVLPTQVAPALPEAAEMILILW